MCADQPPPGIDLPGQPVQRPGLHGQLHCHSALAAGLRQSNGSPAGCAGWAEVIAANEQLQIFLISA